MLKACDKAQTNCQQHTQDQAALLKAQNDQINQLATENTRLREEEAKPSRSPILWFVAGMVATGLTVYLVKK